MVFNKCLNKHTFYHIVHGNLSAYLHLLSDLKLKRCLGALPRIKMAYINPSDQNILCHHKLSIKFYCSFKILTCFISGLRKAKHEGHWSHLMHFKYSGCYFFCKCLCRNYTKGFFCGNEVYWMERIPLMSHLEEFKNPFRKCVRYQNSFIKFELCFRGKLKLECTAGMFTWGLLFTRYLNWASSLHTRSHW